MRLRLNIRATIFDVDGTLIDSFPNGVDVFRAFARHLGRPEPTQAKIAEHWGTDLEYFLEHVFPGVYENDYYKFRKLGDLDSRTIPAFPKTMATLNLLREKYFLGILTNRDPASLKRRMRLAEIPENIFEFIQAKDEHMFAKPSPRAFMRPIKFFSQLSVTSQQMAYVGDMPTDYEAARYAGLNFIAVLTGPTTREKFLAAGVPAKMILNSIAELPNFLSGPSRF